MDSPPVTITNQTPKEKPVVITSEGAKKSMFKFSIVNPKILGAMTVLLLLIGGVGTGVYLTQNRQQSTTQATVSNVELKFQPDKIETDINSQFNVDVFASANESLINSVDLGFKYDPEILTLISIAPGQFLPKILVPPKIASGSATISLGTQGNSGVSGNGIIAGLKFEVSGQAAKSSTKITFDPQSTEIKVLNRNKENANDILGSVEVSIKQSVQNDEQSLSGEPDGTDTTLTETEESDPSTPSGQLKDPSDFNGDGITNSIDLSLMYSGWGNPETDGQKKADLNNDGVINGIDYAQFVPKFKL